LHDRGIVNAAHLHLVVNHAPIFLTFAGILTALWGYRRSEDAWFISFGFWIISGISAGVAYASGGGAAEAIKDVLGVSTASVEPHENVAKFALVLAIVLGLVSVAAIGVRAMRRHPALRGFALAVAILTLVVMGYTANIGGAIHHPEISGAR
jgi:uncharacterized membrane protein